MALSAATLHNMGSRTGGAPSTAALAEGPSSCLPAAHNQLLLLLHQPDCVSQGKKDLQARVQVTPLYPDYRRGRKTNGTTQGLGWEIPRQRQSYAPVTRRAAKHPVLRIGCPQGSKACPARSPLLIFTQEPGLLLHWALTVARWGASRDHSL